MTLRLARKYNLLNVRFKRKGFRNYPLYDIVVANNCRRSKGRFIQRIGFFNPNGNERILVVHVGFLIYWLCKGARMNTSVKRHIVKALNYN